MTKKIHTRAKRDFDLTRGKNPYEFFHGVKKKGAKTFKTEEAANAYAKKQKLKDYTLVKAKKGNS